VVRITVLGSAGAFNGAGRAHSCYWIEDDLGNYVVDFGPTALMQCRRLGKDPSALDGIYVTHLHGDHLAGAAILLIDQQFNVGRTRPLYIGGPPGIVDRMTKLREGTYPSVVQRGLNYPLMYRQWNIPGEVEMLGRRVTAIRAKHDRNNIASSLRINAAGRTLVFSGDTGWQPELGHLSEGADLMIIECTGVDEGFWGHLSVKEIANHRDALLADKVVLSHMSEGSRAVATARAAELRVDVADDGDVIEFD
jgi:ribonuclease BN (tRNA processing enzyme)